MPFDVTAFQLDAFQSGAFQQEVATEYWAFQTCVFQWDAFQVEECTEPVIAGRPGGGIGHGGKKRVYIKRGDKLLLFIDADHAAAWVEADKAIKAAQRRPKNRPQKAISKPEPVQEIRIPVLETLARQYSMAEDLTHLIGRNEYAALAALYERLRQREEEDTLAILLAA